MSDKVLSQIITEQLDVYLHADGDELVDGPEKNHGRDEPPGGEADARQTLHTEEVPPAT